MFYNGKTYSVVNTYNGKDGCQCGCRGNYCADPTTPAFKRRVKKVTSFVGPVRPDAANNGDAVSYSSEAFGGDFYAYVREGERVTVVYFN
jgi:hypothetical protein